MQDLGELNVSCKKQVTKTSWSVFKWQRFQSSEEECHQEDSDLFRWLYLPSVLSRNVWAVWKRCSKRAYENLLQQMGNVRDEEQRSASLLGKSRVSLQQWLHDHSHTSWSESKQHECKPSLPATHWTNQLSRLNVFSDLTPNTSVPEGARL